jgi:ubiquinone/menaquinone biosynthesis C-methylase UbiE
MAETYTPGYSEVAVRYMSRRHAARDAAFLLPRLKPGMALLDCACGPGTITI